MFGTLRRIEEEGGSPEYVTECRRVVREVCGDVVTCLDDTKKRLRKAVDKIEELHQHGTKKYKNESK